MSKLIIDKQYRYLLPKHPNDRRQIGQLVGSANAIECAEIIERHIGLVILITRDMKSALRLNDEIQQFTTKPISMFPDWETLPYDSFSPNQDIISTRLSRLYQLPIMNSGAIILPIHTLMQRVCPYKFLQAHALAIKIGQQLSIDTLQIKVEKAGYRSVDQVIEHGEFSRRRECFDLYPMGSNDPYRIYFFNDKIDSLRLFNINTQLTLKEVEQMNLLPAHEFPIDQSAIELFRSQWRQHFKICREAEHLYQKVSKGILTAGIEYWQPLFFREPLPTLFNYFPNHTLVITIGNLEDAATQFWRNINKRYENRNSDLMRQLVEPDKLWINSSNIFSKLKTWPRIQLKQEKLSDKNKNINLSYQVLPELSVKTGQKKPLDNLNKFIKVFTGSIVFSVDSEGRKKILLDLLMQIQLDLTSITKLCQATQPGYYLMIGKAEQGFIDQERKLAFICENDLFGKRINKNKQDNNHTINTDSFIRSLEELRPGQPVVHIEQGVGRYQGMTTLETGNIKAEYLIISYADQDKLYIPISSLHLISRYCAGSEQDAPIHKLGGDVWQRIRQKSAEKIRDVAAELLDTYSQRAAKPGFSFKQNDQQYRLFCQDFPFDTTPDQEKTINAVLNDMCKPLAMDRLVCGDVGFGKTEVAMRATFLAIINKKQTAVLVPTTLLAQQHFDNIRDRFARWEVKIELLSRFRSLKEQKNILKKAYEGKIDIIIGTHKLLQPTLKWKNLGLLIIDEEHRFGVRHKEQIKALYTNIDILTLTATPIPRTLNMAMSGIRDVSIISTPPARRLAVKTFVCEYDELLLREAIIREIFRGGQVFYLYNDVEKIESIAKKLELLVPEANISIGHGQMRERDLERVINDFYHQRFNILVCTTIIETGIDVPNANTIIIERSDLLGLAQLYQLRGRVGRSHNQAYAYLLIPSIKNIKSDAKKRLEAISALEKLGAGFTLATHDLEIRGAGELLGEEQSGQMTTIGFSLYIEMLKNAIHALKEGREPSLKNLIRQQTEIEMQMPVLLPDDFINDVNIRLSFYKRIANAIDDTELNRLKVELIDRFGKLPDATNYLLKISSLQKRAQKLGIKRIESNEHGGLIEFTMHHHINLSYLSELLQNQQQIYKLEGSKKLKFIKDLSNRIQRLKFVEEVLNNFEKNSL